MRRRSNGDEGRRSRERRARTEGVGGEAVLADMMRAGLPPAAVEFAAVLGDEAARVAMPAWRDSIHPGWVEVRRGDAAVHVRPMMIDYVAFFAGREEWGPPLLLEAWRRSCARVDALIGRDPPYLVRRSLDDALRLTQSHAFNGALEEQRIAFGDAYGIVNRRPLNEEDRRTLGWGMEVQAQRDDLVALLLQRPLAPIVASNPPRARGDEHRRQLERRAAQGDPEAAAALQAAQERLEQLCSWCERPPAGVTSVDGDLVCQFCADDEASTVRAFEAATSRTRARRAKLYTCRGMDDTCGRQGICCDDDSRPYCARCSTRIFGFILEGQTHRPYTARAESRERRNPPELPVPASRQHFLPALTTSGRLPRGEYVPPVTSFELATSGATPLVYVPEGSYEHQPANDALATLVTTPGALAAPGAWDDLIARVGTRATVYLIDRRGEQWRVRDVVYYPGGRDGALDVEHLGRRGRMRVDLREAYGHVLPVLVYKPLRANPCESGCAWPEAENPLKTCDPSARPLSRSLVGKKVRVHLNLHNGCYVVSVGGKVQGYTTGLTLGDVTSKVSKAGYQRCRDEQVRNVHAWLEGKLLDVAAGSTSGMERVSYNCLTSPPCFYFLNGGACLKRAARAVCQPGGRVWVKS